MRLIEAKLVFMLLCVMKVHIYCVKVHVLDISGCSLYSEAHSAAVRGLSVSETNSGQACVHTPVHNKCADILRQSAYFRDRWLLECCHSLRLIQAKLVFILLCAIEVQISHASL